VILVVFALLINAYLLAVALYILALYSGFATLQADGDYYMRARVVGGSSDLTANTGSSGGNSSSAVDTSLLVSPLVCWLC
jgi:hypothetical protein